MEEKLYTNGKVTIKATEKAFKVIYEDQGFRERKTPVRRSKKNDA